MQLILKKAFFFNLLITLCSFVFALSITDETGRTIEIAKTPKRIVSLGPSATEIIFALGAEKALVARTDFCNYPLEATQISSLGGFDGKFFSIEKIISYKPDFVYGFAVMHDYLIPILEKYKIPIYLSNATTIEQIVQEISDMGKILDKEERAQEVTTDITNRITTVQNRVRTTIKDLNLEKRKVYWEVWNSPYMSCGKQSYINSLISLAGGVNIFAEIEQAYPVVSEESIIMANPDIILFPDDSGLSLEALSNRKNWKSLNALKNLNAFSVPADVFSRSGPRVAEAVEILAQRLYPAP